jgi:hypothetical protein
MAQPQPHRGGQELLLIIDRFEGEWAVVEWDGTVFNVPRAMLPRDAREGDVLGVSITSDAGATEARRQRSKRLEDELFGK